MKPKEVGLLNGKLRPCPPAPKCVSSYYAKGIHHIEPLKYSGPKENAYNKILSIINSIEKSKIVKQEENYIYAQFELSRFKWIDNMEFLFDDENKIIHYSSTPSAKIGFWDWGANKRRANIIQQQFEK